MEDLKISDEEPAQPVYGGGPVPWALFSRQTGVKFGNKTVLGVSQAIESWGHRHVQELNERTVYRNIRSV